MSGPVLWLLSGEISPEILREEARRLGYLAVAQLNPDRPTEILSRRLGDLTAGELLALRTACYRRIGIDDPDAHDLERIRSSSWYQLWHADRVELRRRLGYVEI